MRKIIICLSIILSVTSGAIAQNATGINFFKGSWEQLLAAARMRKLPVFVDVYTDWCAPCKRMEQEIFILPEVGKFYNEHFLCFRLNAEKGEGPALAKKYGVSAYPTWLYVDGDGTLRKRSTDYMAAAKFINSGQAALGNDSASNRLAAFDKRFGAGERNAEFLRAYLEMRTALQLNNADVLNAYVAARKGRTPDTDELLFLVRNTGRTWSASIPLITNHLQLFNLIERKKVAADLYDHSLYFAWGDAVKSGDIKTSEQAMAAAERLYPLLDEAKQLNYDHVALYHCRKLKLAVGLKDAGYRLAVKQMAIDTILARQKDKVLFDQAMKPFISGEKDSTKIPDFNEGKQLAAKQYSANAASLLYEAAEAFAEVLPPTDPAQKDAIQWAKRAYILAPNEHTRALYARLAGSSK